MKLYKGFFLLTAIACFLSMLASCLHMPPPPLRVGANVWPGYESLYLARDLGYYDDSPIQLVDYPSATEVSRALRNGDLEVAALTLDETLALAETNPDVRVVLITDFSAGGDAIIAASEIETLAELKGQKVGVESTALGAFVISRALEQAGLSIEDVEIISLGVSEHEAAFKQGIVDAVVTFEPVRSNLLAEGANLIFDSTQIPGEIVDVLVVPQAVLDHQKKTLDLLVKGWFRALDYLHQNPQDAAKRMAPREGISPDQFLASLELLHIPDLTENKTLLSQTDPTLPNVAGQLSELMIEQNLLQQALETEVLFDNRLVDTLP